MTLATTLAADPRRCSRGFDLRTQHPMLCGCSDPAPVAPDEFSTFLAALRSSVRSDGTVHVNDVRPKVRGVIPAKHIGQMWTKASRRGLIRHDGWEPSTDVQGANADKMARIWRWLGGAA